MITVDEASLLFGFLILLYWVRLKPVEFRYKRIMGVLDQQFEEAMERKDYRRAKVVVDRIQRVRNTWRKV